MNFKLPYSFDPVVLTDRLLITLDRSPHTKSFATIRVNQIIQDIVQSSIIKNLEHQIMQQHAKFDQKQQQHYILLQRYADIEFNYQKLAKKFTTLEKQYEVSHKKTNQLLSNKKTLEIKSQKKANSKRQQKQLQKQRQKSDNLKKQIEKLKQKIIHLQSVNQQLQYQFNSKIQQLDEQLSKRILEINQKDKLIIQLENNKKNQLQKRQSLLLSQKQSLKQQMRKQYQIKITQVNRKLLAEQQKISEINKQRQNLNKINLQIEFKLKQKDLELKNIINKYELIKKEYQQFKQNVKQKFLSKQRQKKALSQKLTQLTQKYHLQQRILIKEKQQLKTIKQLKKHLQMLKQSYQKDSKKILINVQKNFQGIMEQIGIFMNRQLQRLMAKISKITGQAKIYKQQIKVKDQIIQRLQRMLQSENNSTAQLRNELRLKKKEEDRLRKQLSKHYEETQVKLNSMQKKYKEILSESTHMNNF